MNIEYQDKRIIGWSLLISGRRQQGINQYRRSLLRKKLLDKAHSSYQAMEFSQLSDILAARTNIDTLMIINSFVSSNAV